jgi:carbon-monoxide dehydrogenase medium subunit
MYPASFEYFRPVTLEETVALLVRHGADAKVLAGGQSLIPAMKLRLARPKVLVDIGRVANLSYIREADGHIAIGAMTTHGEIEASSHLRERCPLLPETASHIGDVQVRNRGTIGGSLAHADPAADWPAAILALGAEIDVVGPRGRRTVSAATFFVDLMETVIQPDEILCEIRVRPTPRSVAYEKTEQKASGFALAGVAVAVSNGDGTVRIGVTGVAAKPYRATAVERALAGQRAPTAATVAAAAARVAMPADALSDIHASPDYRAHLARVNAQRALTRAFAVGG